MTILERMGADAKKASLYLAATSSKERNDLLESAAAAIEKNKDAIFEANAKDCENARANHLKLSFIDRLMLDDKRLSGITDAIGQVIKMPDPLGRMEQQVRPNGLRVGRVSVPLGVIGIIYESRPNVTVDAASLCLKSGNAVILRGGKEAIYTNIALANAMNTVLPSGCVGLIENTDRETAVELMNLRDYLNVLIPRGGSDLIRNVKLNSSVPVIETGAGNCHVYVDDSADIKMADDIIFNAKVSRPSVCNAAETLLVSKSIAEKFLPVAAEHLSGAGVEIRGCEKTREILPSCTPAVEDDWYTEYNELILACKIVDGTDEAIKHINAYSTGHSECIVTSDYANAMKFVSRIDSAAVYVNASTRFTDGNEFGYGMEIGISTQKLHVRGPMGLDAMTSSKYIIFGDGQIRL